MSDKKDSFIFETGKLNDIKRELAKCINNFTLTANLIKNFPIEEVYNYLLERNRDNIEDVNFSQQFSIFSITRVYLSSKMQYCVYLNDILILTMTRKNDRGQTFQVHHEKFLPHVRYMLEYLMDEKNMQKLSRKMAEERNLDSVIESMTRR